MSAGTVADGFWTSLQKHLTPFHKKILVRSSILKKILASDSGWVIGTVIIIAILFKSEFCM